MAKSDSLIKLQGTLAGLTFVKSLAYGEHVRAKRGTYKKAEVNASFKRESKRLQRTNVPAKIFKDAITPHLSHLANGELWPRLLSVIHKQLKTQGTFDFSYFAPFEINADYTFERFLQEEPKIRFEKRKRTLHIGINYKKHPVFKRAAYVDGYRLTAIAIFPNLKKKSAETVVAESEVIRLKGAVPSLSLQLKVPLTAIRWVVCIRIEGYSGDEVCNTPVTKGMRIAEAGVI